MKRRLTLLLLALAGSHLVNAQTPGQKICYESGDNVWIANPDGTSPKKIAGGQMPSLSPDGARLAYNTVQDVGKPAHRQLTVVDLASGKSTLLKDIPSDNCMAPTWSPDGKQLLFEYYANNDRHIGVVNADGTGFRYVQESEPKHLNYWSESWAADGKSFFAQDMEKLYLLDLYAKILKTWDIQKLIPGGGMSGDVRLDASPDGKSLLMDIEMDEKERKGWDGPPPAIWLLDLTTQKFTRLTPKSLYGWDSHWLKAPDSILFLSQNPGEQTDSIYRMSTTGQGKDRKLLVKDALCPGASR